MLDESSARRLERLHAKDCLYQEPSLVEAHPKVHFDLQPAARIYHPTYSLIEVHDGKRQVVVVQGQLSGISGAIGKVVLDQRYGFDFSGTLIADPSARELAAPATSPQPQEAPN